MAGNNSESSLYQVLVEWCQRMETSQARLREDVDDLLLQEESRTGKESATGLETEAEKEAEVEVEAEAADSWDNPTATWERAVSGFYFADSAYRTLMDSMGHAIHVTSAASGEITFWSRSAENLYHWYAEEVVGYRTIDVLVTEEYRNSLTGIRNRVCRGETWTGQFPFQKKTGELFMALVTKSPVYENGELVGVVTVSSDATLFNRMHPLSNEHQQQARSNNRHESNLRKHQWHLPRPQIAAASQVPVVPQYSSAVASNLASKLLPQRNGDDSFNGNHNSRSRDENVPVVASTTFEKYGSLADKFLGKLQRKITGSQGTEDNEPILRNGINKSACGSGGSSKASNAVTCTAFRDNGNGKPKRAEVRISDVYGNGAEGLIHNGDRFQYIGNLGQSKPPRGLESGLVSGMRGTKMSDLNGEIEDAWNTRLSVDPLPILGVNSGRQQSPVNQRNNRLVTDSSCEIRWEDLQLGEEVGRGSFAAVHRGVWNGSDVAIKVYFDGDYNAMTLTECKKEINIMKKLRHPNVLLFMGAVCTEEKSAIIMEYMPRGSLFKILHNTNQPLEKKRRLRMALDVARGMNYLHRRNPPIVHRDLKSSNLLVDKNWNVKVGDFGLSKWKNATFLSTKSGKGTPQWMAPEVLRSEPSNEKCDVFSFGVILWELMTTLVPWDRLNSIQVVGVVGFMDRRLDLPEGLNPRIASIIQDCWQTDPAKRPSFEELISQMMSLFRKPGSGAQEEDD